MKLFLALLGLFAAASAFSLNAAPAARANVLRAPAAVAVESETYDAKTAWIKVPTSDGKDKFVDLKELTPWYVLIGSLFFVHDYAHFQLGMFTGEPI